MKTNSRILKIIFWLIVLIAVADIVALKFYLYEDFWWLDIVMHFLGGFWVGLSAVWLLVKFGWLSETRLAELLAAALAATLLAALIWEFFELKVGLAATGEFDYWPDTISDILTALSAAALAVLFFRKTGGWRPIDEN